MAGLGRQIAFPELPGFLHTLWATVPVLNNAAINIATDMIVIVVPAMPLWRLQMPRRPRIILMCLFGVGLFATATSIIRLHALSWIAIVLEAQQSGKMAPSSPSTP